MGLIRIYEKSPKAKRKPGWQKQAQEYAEWQSKIASMSSGITGAKKAPKPKNVEPQVAQILPGKYVVGSGTKAVPRPELTYRHDPELLERELAARSIRHNAAPAYNKGGDQYVTEEALQQLLSSNKRRS
jgi:hypothetical protein